MSSMISLWITIGLIIAGTLVSTLGAYFSIIGLGALFSGAVIAVWLMAGSLEFAKFILAAYLHQTWKNLNIFFKVYLTSAVVILSTITSIGVFGFLSDAYQSASHSLEEQTIKLESLKKQNDFYTSEIERLNYSVEEIPEDRVSRRLQARAVAEPKILELNRKIEENENKISQTNMAILDVKKKVGPLIFIAKSLKIDIDTVVRYLIIIFVIVFDPLAICLVIASTYAIDSRSALNKKRHEMHLKKMQFQLSQELAKELLAENELEKEIQKQNTLNQMQNSLVNENNLNPLTINNETLLNQESVYPSKTPLNETKVDVILEKVTTQNSEDLNLNNKDNNFNQEVLNEVQNDTSENVVSLKEEINNVIQLPIETADLNKVDEQVTNSNNSVDLSLNSITEEKVELPHDKQEAISNLNIDEEVHANKNETEMNIDSDKSNLVELSNNEPVSSEESLNNVNEEISEDDVVVQMNFKDPGTKKSS